MSMNVVHDGSNMYPFIDMTKNYCKGKCYFDCVYCYVKRWGELNPLYFDEKELSEDLYKHGEGKFLFIGSSNDVFAENIPHLWIMKILEHCRKFPKNKYLFQSKNPKRFYDFLDLFPPKTVLCMTLESDVLHEGISQAPAPIERFVAFKGLPDRFEKSITVEPIMSFNCQRFLMYLRECKPTFISIGANTSAIKLPEPSSYEIAELINGLRILKFDVKLKKNLKRLYDGT